MVQNLQNRFNNIQLKNQTVGYVFIAPESISEQDIPQRPITPEYYRDEKDRVEKHYMQELERILALQERVKMPNIQETREATPRDIVLNNIIFYYEQDGEQYWKIIKEIISPNDSFKAYCAEDGCRYGLDGARVRK